MEQVRKELRPETRQRLDLADEHSPWTERNSRLAHQTRSENRKPPRLYRFGRQSWNGRPTEWRSDLHLPREGGDAVLVPFETVITEPASSNTRRLRPS